MSYVISIRLNYLKMSVLIVQVLYGINETR